MQAWDRKPMPNTSKWKFTKMRDQKEQKLKLKFNERPKGANDKWWVQIPSIINHVTTILTNSMKNE